MLPKLMGHIGLFLCSQKMLVGPPTWVEGGQDGIAREQGEGR